MWSDNEQQSISWEIERACAPLERRIARLTEALEPFARFARYAKAHPRFGLADTLYAWDCDPDAEIRLSELMKALAAIEEK